MRNLDFLRTRLEADLYAVGLTIKDIDLIFRPFSSSFYGRYFFSRERKPKIHLYPFKNVNEELMR